LNVSLGQILDEGMEARWKRHCALGRACQQAIAALGLGQVPLTLQDAAHTMTAPRYPSGVNGAQLLSRVKEAGAILAGGLHPAIKAEYFRIGHMGPSKLGDLLATIGALETGLAVCGYSFQAGAGVAAAAVAYRD
jgi:alanine-glyoxylate transaminase/serine-glyoxylate transaminase/serine-pyruvate transaminase